MQRHAILGMLLAIATTATCVHAAVVYTDASGNQWRDVRDTINLSWNQLASVCATDGTTACSGVVGGVDLTGWTWATQSETAALFYEVTGFYPYHSEVNSSWASAALSIFAPTEGDATYSAVFGWTSSVYSSPTYSYRGYIIDRFGSAALDEISVSDLAPPASSLSFTGAWLFRAVSAVPEPKTNVMLLAGLGLLGFVARRRVKRETLR